MVLTAREVELFEGARGRLEALAYRLLGSAGGAEDAVQDVFLRWQAADRDRVESPEAWLTRALTNVCLNELTSARVRRETYVGQWLPEPVLAGDRMLGPADTVEQRDSVSIAVLIVLERLSPKERAVYVLREAFGHPHSEIARILDITESSCQQLYRRAKQHLATHRTRTAVDPGTAGRIVEEFLGAARSGEVEPLVRMLTDDAVSVADGGGEVPARTTPIVGALGIARYLRGLFRSTAIAAYLGGAYAVHTAVVNGGPAVLVVADARVVGVMSLDATADGVAALAIQVHPGKLERISRQWAISHAAPDTASDAGPSGGGGGE